jgi:dihydropteroate synthase
MIDMTGLLRRADGSPRNGGEKAMPSRNDVCIMGILNCSPDSFFNGATGLDATLHQAEQMIEAGADILDVGGEATNPAISIQVSSGDKAQLQCERVLPVIEAIRQHFDIQLSIDTSEPLVIQETVDAGVNIINDQRSLQLPGAAEAAIKADVPVILMHSYLMNEPVRQADESVVERVKREWLEQLTHLQQQGLRQENVILDPGFGQGNFGKNLQENCELLAQLPELVVLGYPVLVGWSRKSMIGDLAGGCPPRERLPGSLAAALIAVQNGAAILRVHDVAETVQAVNVLCSVGEL